MKMLNSLQSEHHDKPVSTGPLWLHIAVLVVVAMALTYPCIRRGLPEGHSSFTHMLYQHYFDQQISRGDPYPRWIISMNRGLGGGVFYAQYPLPYYVPWAIGKVIPIDWGPYEEARTQGLAMMLAAILACLFTYAWCATFADRFTAMLAAIVYLTFPYSLTIDIYLRAAIGEFWALAFLPLSFYFIERMAAGSRRAMPGLAVAFALVIVSHLFTAVLLAPVLVVYAMWRVGSGRRLLATGELLAAFLLATGLSGVYALPFLANRKFFHPESFLATQGGNASPLSQMFTFNAFTFPATWERHGWLYVVIATRLFALAAAAYIAFRLFRSRMDKPQWLRWSVGAISIAALVRAALAGRHFFPAGEVAGALPLSEYLTEQRAELFLYSFLTFVAALVGFWSLRDTRHKRVAGFLMALALSSYLMMTSWTLFIWRTVHFLWNIQFPWRLNTFLLAATAGLAALAISSVRAMPDRQRRAGALIAFGIWAMVAVTSARMGHTYLAFRSSERIQFRDEMDSAREIYMQVDPRQAYLVKPPDDEKVHVAVEQGAGIAAIEAVKTRSIEIDARCHSDCILKVGQFYYPAWRVESTPAANIRLYAGLPGGLMNVSLPAGEYHLILKVPYSVAERMGALLSLICVLVVVLVAITGTPFLQRTKSLPNRERITSEAGTLTESFTSAMRTLN